VKKIILIDGNSILFRAYHATASNQNILMQTKKGEYTNALFAFINMFVKIVNSTDNVLVAFDTNKPTFRHLDYSEYKAGRKKIPEELVEQIPLVYEFLNLMGVKYYFKEGYEADDIIGIYAHLASSQNYDVSIYSSDKDLLQLVRNNVTVNLLKKGTKEIDSYTPEKLFEEYDLRYDQIIDLKAIMGDKSDNIPGILGIGIKGATELLIKYQNLENIYKNIDEIKGKIKEKLKANYDTAILSKKLVTIQTKGNLDYNLDDFKRVDILENKLIDFLRRYELNSLIRQLNLSKKNVSFNFEYIETEAEFKEKLAKVSAIHFEFEHHNYHSANLLGIGYYNGKNSYYVNKNLLTSEVFKNYLKSNDYLKCAYDFKAIKTYLLYQKQDLKNVFFDVHLAAYIADSNDGKMDLDLISEKYGIENVIFNQNIYAKGETKKIIDENSHERYVANKAFCIYKLKEILEKKLLEKDQLNLLKEIEMPLAHILAKMEFAGISISKEELEIQKKDLEKNLENLKIKIYEAAGVVFNIDSPKILGSILFEKLGLKGDKKNKFGFSTNIDVLEKIKDNHPIVPLIIEFRELNKLYTTYIIGLEKTISDDGKIHTIFKQALTTTGRLSSIEPNLQNIPTKSENGKKIKKLFVAEKNNYFLSSDYSQIELRVLANIADEKNLQEAFNDDKDIHSQTAKSIFNMEEIDAEKRRFAKTINFGIIYGMSAFSLAEDLKISVAEAKIFIEKYFEKYPGIKKYMEDIHEFALTNGFVETKVKRRRYINELKSPIYAQKEFGRRIALNAPIQATAADILKLAMIKIDNYLGKNNKKSKILLQIHDELIFEIIEEELEEMKIVIPKLMEEAYKMKVKLKASCNIGKSWFSI